MIYIYIMMRCLFVTFLFIPPCPRYPLLSCYVLYFSTWHKKFLCASQDLAWVTRNEHFLLCKSWKMNSFSSKNNLEIHCFIVWQPQAWPPSPCELSSGGVKRDVEKTHKYTKLNWNKASLSTPGQPGLVMMIMLKWWASICSCSLVPCNELF